jgi:hypothetical protein
VLVAGAVMVFWALVTFVLSGRIGGTTRPEAQRLLRMGALALLILGIASIAIGLFYPLLGRF